MVLDDDMTWTTRDEHPDNDDEEFATAGEYALVRGAERGRGGRQ